MANRPSASFLACGQMATIATKTITPVVQDKISLNNKISFTKNDWVTMTAININKLAEKERQTEENISPTVIGVNLRVNHHEGIISKLQLIAYEVATPIGPPRQS